MSALIFRIAAAKRTVYEIIIVTVFIEIKASSQIVNGLPDLIRIIIMQPQRKLLNDASFSGVFFQSQSKPLGILIARIIVHYNFLPFLGYSNYHALIYHYHVEDSLFVSLTFSRVAFIIHDPDKLIEVIEQRDLLVGILLTAKFDSRAAVAATLVVFVNPKFHNNAPFHGGIRSSQSPTAEIPIIT